MKDSKLFGQNESKIVKIKNDDNQDIYAELTV